MNINIAIPRNMEALEFSCDKYCEEMDLGGDKGVEILNPNYAAKPADLIMHIMADNDSNECRAICPLHKQFMTDNVPYFAHMFKAGSNWRENEVEKSTENQTTDSQVSDAEESKVNDSSINEADKSSENETTESQTADDQESREDDSGMNVTESEVAVQHAGFSSTILKYNGDLDPMEEYFGSLYRQKLRLTPTTVSGIHKIADFFNDEVVLRTCADYLKTNLRANSYLFPLGSAHRCWKVQLLNYLRLLATPITTVESRITPSPNIISTTSQVLFVGCRKNYLQHGLTALLLYASPTILW